MKDTASLSIGIVCTKTCETERNWDLLFPHGSFFGGACLSDTRKMMSSHKKTIQQFIFLVSERPGKLRDGTELGLAKNEFFLLPGSGIYQRQSRRDEKVLNRHPVRICLGSLYSCMCLFSNKNMFFNLIFHNFSLCGFPETDPKSDFLYFL